MSNYTGLIISAHKTLDSVSKQKAATTLFGWQQVSLPAEEWIQKLTDGHTIQPSEFTTNDQGHYTHKKENWQKTYFVCADADNIKGVEVLQDGTEKNPDGVEYWTEQHGLLKRYPALRDKVYAVTESVSSMQEREHITTPHRRYRFIFLFDAPITSEETYHAVIQTLYSEFPIISNSDRSPAQPVFGNAREGFDHSWIAGNILKLEEYLPDTQDTPEKPTESPNSTQIPQGDTPTLEEFIAKHSILTISSRKEGGYYVECPYTSGHTGMKCGPTDAYIWENTDGSFAFYCSHEHCADKRTWEAFREGCGIKRTPYTERTQTKRKETPVITDDMIDTDYHDETTLEFPDSVIFGPFENYVNAFKGKTEVPTEFHFATLKNMIGTVLGRQVYLDLDQRTYPNNYTALLGKSAVTRKSSAIWHGGQLLRSATESVMQLESLATPEGLVASLRMPVTDNDAYSFINYMEDPENDALIQRIIEECLGEEGIRMQAQIDELTHLLKINKRAVSERIPDKLLTLYNYPRRVSINTKIGPFSAPFPCFNLIGASVLDVFKNHISEELIFGGLANRFEYYISEASADWIAIPQKSDAQYWTPVRNFVGNLRNTTPRNVAVTFSEDATELFTEWYIDQRKMVSSIDNHILQAALGRSDLQVKKNALIFAVCRWNADTQYLIETIDLERAMDLQDYLHNTIELVYADVAPREMRDIDERILQHFKKHPRTTFKKMLRYVTKYSVPELDKSLKLLVQNDVIHEDDSGQISKFVVMK